MADFESFMYTYIVFLCFILFIFTLPGSVASMFGGSLEGYNITTPTYHQPEASGYGLIDFFTSAGASVTYITENLALFFTLMTVDAGVTWVSMLIFTPAIIFLLWGLIKMVRGTT